MNRSTVYAWLAKHRQGGEAALAAKPVPGRPSKLSGRQLARLYTLIVGQLSFGFALWTREMVREVIRSEFGVYHMPAAASPRTSNPGLGISDQAGVGGSRAVGRRGAPAQPGPRQAKPVGLEAGVERTVGDLDDLQMRQQGPQTLARAVDGDAIAVLEDCRAPLTRTV